MLAPVPRLFGSTAKTEILLALALLKETYAQELARVLELAPTTVFRVLEDLEREGIILSRHVGRTRLVGLSPRMYGASELEALLQKYVRRTDLEERIARIRRRPRRRGKEV
jgi:DNA-binding transcriptional ArsR family regulator